MAKESTVVVDFSPLWGAFNAVGPAVGEVTTGSPKIPGLARLLLVRRDVLDGGGTVLTRDEDESDGGDHLNKSPDERDGRSPDRPRVVDSDLIFAGHREAWIRHGGEMYRLRITSAGKLYLSK